MRFVCDHNVDASVVAALNRRGHDAWTVGKAGLADAKDDDLTVYAGNHHAVLITHDTEFSQRRRKTVIGRHIWLRCVEWEAAELLTRHLDDIIPALESRTDLWVRISKDRVDYSSTWT